MEARRKFAGLGKDRFTTSSSLRNGEPENRRIVQRDPWPRSADQFSADLNYSKDCAVSIRFCILSATFCHL